MNFQSFEKWSSEVLHSILFCKMRLFFILCENALEKRERKKEGGKIAHSQSQNKKGSIFRRRKRWEPLTLLFCSCFRTPPLWFRIEDPVFGIKEIHVFFDLQNCNSLLMFLLEIGYLKSVLHFFHTCKLQHLLLWDPSPPAAGTSWKERNANRRSFFYFS